MLREETYIFHARSVIFCNSKNFYAPYFLEQNQYFCVYSVAFIYTGSTLTCLLSYQTSFSTVAKRAFSSLPAAFNDQQDQALVDYMPANVMLQYNNSRARGIVVVLVRNCRHHHFDLCM